MKFLRYPDLKPEKGIPFTRQHIATLEKEGKFPRRVWLGRNTSGWFEQQIDEYLAACLASQRGWREERRLAGNPVAQPPGRWSQKPDNAKRDDAEAAASA
jgi:predicted DNA-binding transcriptional regulator AlpA